MAPMNIIHAARRALGWHPLRRDGEPQCTADVLADMRRDLYNFGRRHDDVVADVRASRRDRKKVNKLLTDASTSG